MSYWTLLTGVVQILAIIAAWLKKQQIVDETNKARLSEALARIAVAVDIADEVRHDVMRMTDEELDAELMR
jgi:hypothetical protein